MLATLGYAPARRRGGSRSRVARVLLLGGAIAAGWIGWSILRRPDARVPAGGALFVAGGSGSARLPAATESRRGSLPTVISPALSSPGLPIVSEKGAPGADAEGVQPVSFSGAAPAPLVPSTAPTRPQPSPAEARAPALPVRQPSPVAATEPPAPPALPAAPANDLDLALYYHRAGDFENALQHYRALLRANELNAQAHNNLGLLYQERNLLDESARELQRAIVIEPRNAGAHNNYGVTLLKQGRPDEALAEFGAAMALSPRSVDAIVNRALAERDARQPGIAKETLLRALAIEPRNPAAHYNLAQLYDQTNETGGALEHYRRFLENAGAEYASRAAAVRARIEALTRGPD